MIYRDVNLDFIAEFNESAAIRDIIMKSITYNGNSCKPISAAINVSTEYGSFSINDVFLNSISTESIVDFSVPSFIKCKQGLSNAVRIKMGGVAKTIDIEYNELTDLEKLTHAITNFKKAISELENVELTDLKITANKELLTVL